MKFCPKTRRHLVDADRLDKALAVDSLTVEEIHAAYSEYQNLDEKQLKKANQGEWEFLTNQMNENMVKAWNATVNPEDLVYILGDIAFMPGDKAAKFLHRMNGRKILVEGNHDVKQLKDKNFRECFEEVHKYLEIQWDKRKLVMFHYPIMEWNQMYRGALHFHGHLHGSPSGLEEYRARDMGYDATGQIVMLMEDAIEDARKGEIKGHH
jgi:calcineurin-like phosphoesterase family protein